MIARHHGRVTEQCLAVENGLELVQQLLRAAQAERGNQGGAAILQCAVNNLFQLLLAHAAIGVQAVAVGTFQHQQVCALGWLQWAQQRVAFGAEVAGENDAVVLLGHVYVALHIGRAEQVPCALQAHLAPEAGLVYHGVPLTEGHRHDQVTK